MAVKVENNKSTPIVVNTQIIAQSLSQKLIDELNQKTDSPPSTIKYNDASISVDQAIQSLIDFAQAQNISIPSLELSISSLKSYQRTLNAHFQEILSEQEAARAEKEAGNIPDYITLPDEETGIKPKRLQVEKHLKELRQQIAEIEKQNLSKKLELARQALQTSQKAVEQEIKTSLKKTIPTQVVSQIFKEDAGKLEAAYHFAANTTDKSEEITSQALYAFAQSSLGGQFLLNRLENEGVEQVSQKAAARLTPSQNNQIKEASNSIRILKKSTQNITPNHIAVAVYDNLIKNHSTDISRTRAQKEAVLVAQSINQITQTNQPILLSVSTINNAVKKTLHGVGIGKETTTTLLGGGDQGVININSGVLAGVVLNKIESKTNRHQLKHFTVPLFAEINSDAASVGTSADPKITSLSSLLAGSSHINSSVSLITRDRQITADQTYEGSRFKRILDRLRSGGDKVEQVPRLLLHINRLAPGAVPSELLSASKIATSPLKSLSGLLKKPLGALGKGLASKASVVVKKLTTTAIKLGARAVSAIGSAIAKIAAAASPEIAIIVFVVIIIIIVLALLFKSFNLNQESAFLFPVGDGTTTNFESIDIEGKLCWPVIGRVSQTPEGYRGPYEPPKKHGVTCGKAVDIAQNGGALVFLPFDGTLVFAGDCGSGGFDPGYGKCVVVNATNNGSTFKIIFAHFAEVAGLPNNLTKGMEIGIVNSTGDSTGDHLHYEICDGPNVREVVPEPNFDYGYTINADNLCIE